MTKTLIAAALLATSFSANAQPNFPRWEAEVKPMVDKMESVAAICRVNPRAEVCDVMSTGHLLIAFVDSASEQIACCEISNAAILQTSKIWSGICAIEPLTSSSA